MFEGCPRLLLSLPFDPDEDEHSPEKVVMPSPTHSLALKRALLGVTLAAVRPYLRLHLALYNRKMRRGVFPEATMERMVPGPAPQRLLFVGDIAVAGYGVLLDGMAFPAQVAQIFSGQHDRGCTWEQVTTFDLTAKKAAALLGDEATGVDVAVVALGIPDVLLVTDRATWERHLQDLIATIRDRASSECRIVITGLPPMDRFQPLPGFVEKAFSLQMARLDEVSAALASRSDDLAFVPFPTDDFGSMYLRDVFSFRAMHRLWAKTVAPHLTRPDAPVAAAGETTSLLVTAQG